VPSAATRWLRCVSTCCAATAACLFVRCRRVRPTASPLAGSASYCVVREGLGGGATCNHVRAVARLYLLRDRFRPLWFVHKFRGLLLLLRLLLRLRLLLLRLRRFGRSGRCVSGKPARLQCNVSGAISLELQCTEALANYRRKNCPFVRIRTPRGKQSLAAAERATTPVRRCVRVPCADARESRRRWGPSPGADGGGVPAQMGAESRRRCG
jgi:hypothetical protein